MSEQCYQVAPGRRASVQDVVSVSLYGLPIALPPASSVSAKRERGSDPNLLPDFVSRSAIFTKLVNISQKSENEVKINALVEYLNCTTAVTEPVFFKDIIKALNDLNVGGDNAIFNEHDLEGRTALRKLSPETSLHSAVTVGVGSLLVAAASTISKVLDSVSALSCEAVGFKSLDSFDSAVFESSRPHRGRESFACKNVRMATLFLISATGQILSAATLRLLLDGSKRCTSVSTTSSSSNAEKGTSYVSVLRYCISFTRPFL